MKLTPQQVDEIETLALNSLKSLQDIRFVIDVKVQNIQPEERPFQEYFIFNSIDNCQQLLYAIRQYKNRNNND